MVFVPIKYKNMINQANNSIKNLFILVLLLSISLNLFSQKSTKSNLISSENSPMNSVSKPYARYWWFASEIQKKDVRYNLEWLKNHGFGGVEIAWVYPLNSKSKTDTLYTPRQEWLSPEWTEIVDYTVKYADSIGLGCDLTYGTLWPFGDSKVKFEESSQHFDNLKDRQMITRSWEHPKASYVIDHLTPKNYQPYFDRLNSAFPKSTTKLKQHYFIDSWEVETKYIWSDGFHSDFKKKYEYDIFPYMDSIYSPQKKAYLYDYMSLVSEKTLKFYEDFDSTLNAAGVLSRGQICGAPVDVISGFARMDVLESEALLYEPDYSKIPASAALLSGKNIVSCETFTCLYGWPADYMRIEQTADLKLVCDAVFANGVNHIIWHGKAHNKEGEDNVNFYATTHIGDNSQLEPELKEFNAYLEKVSTYLKKGQTYGDVAVYLPTEDSWTNGKMPKEKQFIWAWGYYEMRYVYTPTELNGYNPIWINGEFLKKAKVKNHQLLVGDAVLNALYLDVEYLDYSVLKTIIALNKKGLQVIMKRLPKEPGLLQHADYGMLANKLNASKGVSKELLKDIQPFISGKDVPQHWCRKDGETYYVFFSNPKAYNLKFPLEYGQSLNSVVYTKAVELKVDDKVYPLHLKFEPHQSLLYKIENGKIEEIDIKFIPKTPTEIKRPENYIAPWLLK